MHAMIVTALMFIQSAAKGGTRGRQARQWGQQQLLGACHQVHSQEGPGS